MSCDDISLSKVIVEAICGEYEPQQYMSPVMLEPGDPEVKTDLYKFILEYTFKGHVPINIKEEKVEVTALTSSQPYEYETFSADICTDNSEPHIQQIMSEQRYNCEHCGKWFTQKRNLNAHMRSIHQGEQHQCGECNKTFTEKSKHSECKHCRIRKQEDRRERPHECSVCKKTFRKNSNLSQHRLIHIGVKPQECKVCGSTFRLKSHLTRHVKVVHKGERPHECSMCKKTFSQKSDLSNHILTHGGVNPHECKVCGLTFRNGSTLTRHVKTVHK